MLNIHREISYKKDRYIIHIGSMNRLLPIVWIIYKLNFLSEISLELDKTSIGMKNISIFI